MTSPDTHSRTHITQARSYTRLAASTRGAILATQWHFTNSDRGSGPIKAETQTQVVDACVFELRASLDSDMAQ